MKRNLPVVVFSSLDALPVNGDQALSDVAAGALRRLRNEQIPLVFHSSKTRAQIEYIYQTLDVRHPFIAENDGAVFIPHDYFGVKIPNSRPVAGYRAIEFGRPYPDVVETLHRAADRLRMKIVGFSDMSVEEVALDCRLSMLQARLAKLREYAEPFRILVAPVRGRQQLTEALRAENLRCSVHGRYEHAGAAVAPAQGVDLLYGLYRYMVGSPLTIGLGDSVNDAGWLRRMDIPLVVDGLDGAVSQALLRRVPKARLTPGTGMAGWAASLEATLDAVRRHGDFDLAVLPTVRRSWH